MNSKALIIFAAGGSLALLLGAFAFQFLADMAPCKLCLWQRYPHAVAVAVGIVAFFAPARFLILAGALAALTTAGIGAYHVGVEQTWWEGPTTCTAGPIGGLDPDALFEQIMSAPLVRCDDIAWQMAGISMAGWNAIASLIFASIWVAALRRS